MDDMAASSSRTVDRLHALGASLGPIWKKHRRDLPSDVREAFVNLMATIGTHVVPDPVEGVAASEQDTRSDIKEVIDLFRLVAVRDPHTSTSSCKVSSTSAARR